MTPNPDVRCPLCHSPKISVALDTPVRTDYRCDYCGKRWTVTASIGSDADASRNQSNEGKRDEA